MDVLIIGGGIGGLTAALCLHREGVHARVFEATQEFKQLGVGINMLPHAMRELSQLGLAAKLGALGVEAREFVFFNRHGQLIFSEPCGLHAGYQYPHFSIHRADLHSVLLAAVHERLGPDSVLMGHRCTGFEQEDATVAVFFEDAATGRALAPQRGVAAIGCDGFHSAVRHQLYPDEGPPVFSGVNVWRGVTRGKPHLSGASVVRCGPIDPGKMVVYAIRNYPDGTQLLNWGTEQRRANCIANDWNKHGKLEDFIAPFKDWHFDWLDIPHLLETAEFILEYPMVDRDPVERWTFGRVTLLGDAAHPMHPRGGNGGAQAILDARALADKFKELDDPVAALAAYEKERLDKANNVVLMNRRQPPDYIIETVEQLTGGKPFDRIEDVISPAELAAISERYKQVAGFDVRSANR